MRKQQQPPDPRGRLDVLAIKMLERTVEQSSNPVVKTLFDTYRQDAERLAEHFLAPRYKNGRIKRT